MSQTGPDVSANSLLGRQLGDYRVLSRLGRGGMAQVFLAEQLSLGRLVALKVLKPELATDPAYIKRFKNEARAAAALVHSNIVQIFEVGEVDGWYYIAQEYVAGMNLSQYLRRNGPVSPLMAVNVMTQIAAALKKANSLGVVHRDIKPENIMLSTDGEVKVADFGLARLSMDKQRTDLTQIGITMGTPLYMSPEQIEGGDVDHRADLYSFGVTCYHMLTGQPPFQGDNPISVAIQHAKEQAVAIETRRPDLPRSLIQIVNRLMAKKPVDRLQTAGDVLDALQGVEVDASAANWQEILKQLRQSSDSMLDVAGLQAGQLAATRRLEMLMRGPRMADRFKRFAWMFGAIVVTFLGGILLARATSPPNLLEVAKNQRSTLPRKATVADQYMYAYFHDSEEGWLSVINYFDKQPPSDSDYDALYIDWAKERLGEFYLGRRQWALAESVYNQFIIRPRPEKLRTIGEYGRAIAKHHLGDSAPAKRIQSDTLPDVLTQILREHWSTVVEELTDGNN